MHDFRSVYSDATSEWRLDRAQEDSPVPDWHGIVLCAGLVPALVCFSILGTNGGLEAQCDTSVAIYLLVQARIEPASLWVSYCYDP